MNISLDMNLGTCSPPSCTLLGGTTIRWEASDLQEATTPRNGRSRKPPSSGTSVVAGAAGQHSAHHPGQIGGLPGGRSVLSTAHTSTGSSSPQSEAVANRHSETRRLRGSAAMERAGRGSRATLAARRRWGRWRRGGVVCEDASERTYCDPPAGTGGRRATSADSGSL